MQRGIAWLLARYIGFAMRTTRWTLQGEAHLAPVVAGAPSVVAFWHERLPLIFALERLARERGMARRVHVLVSRHRDGRFIGAVLRAFDVPAVYGSSSKGGAASLRALLAVLARGEHVGLTPDGPRGPRRRAAAGVAQLAAMAGVPVLPCAAQTSRRIVLRSWDRMVLPLPFGRGVLVCAAPLAVPRQGWRESVPLIEAALIAATEQADRACPR
jgi:lysophospholipid acyltransferase (LPLAT)-like uncharacterized protein